MRYPLYKRLFFPYVRGIQNHNPFGKDTAMETSQNTLSFARVSGKKVEADFDGGCLTQDGGMLLLRRAEAAVGVVKRMVAALRDRRHPSYIDHTCEDLLRQRVFQIACGYEDANDSDELRGDPALKTACERAPRTGADLASQPTLSRWENRVSRTDLYRLARSLLDTFLASYPKPPKKIILDIDDTEDITHGAQQLTLFNAYHKDYCYMPLHLYEGHSGRLITAILRRGRRIQGAEAATILRRVFAAILKAWPKVHITLRGDAHFSTPQVHEVCEEYRVSFILGQAANAKLNELGAPLMDQALAQAEAQAQEGAEEKPVRLFTSFDYQAKSWKCPQRILYKAEVTQGQANPRFVTTNIQDRTPKYLYEKVYCARGRAEGFIKNHKTFLHSDRTSCHRFEANQFRLLLHSAAYVLIHALQHIGLKDTRWETANFDTIQLRLLKIGGRVRELATRIRFHLATSYPLQDVWRRILFNFDTS